MPNDMEDFKKFLADRLFGPTPEGHCVRCKQPFSRANVHTDLGWEETCISRLCEDCFDSITKAD